MTSFEVLYNYYKLNVPRQKFNYAVKWVRTNYNTLFQSLTCFWSYNSQNNHFFILNAFLIIYLWLPTVFITRDFVILKYSISLCLKKLLLTNMQFQTFSLLINSLLLKVLTLISKFKFKRNLWPIKWEYKHHNRTHHVEASYFVETLYQFQIKQLVYFFKYLPSIKTLL